MLIGSFKTQVYSESFYNKVKKIFDEKNINHYLTTYDKCLKYVNINSGVYCTFGCDSCEDWRDYKMITNKEFLEYLKNL